MQGNMTPVELKELFRRLLQAVVPAFRAKTAWPIHAEVVKVRTGGGKADGLHHRYSVDVRALTKDGAKDTDAPVMEDVPLPQLLVGDGVGLFSLPPKGAIVRVAFDYWDPGRPYVASVLHLGYQVPEQHTGELAVKVGDSSLVVKNGDVSVDSGGATVHLSGSIATVTGAQIKLGDGADTKAVRLTELLSWLNQHTHPLPEPLSPPPPDPPVLTKPPVVVAGVELGSLTVMVK